MKDERQDALTKFDQTLMHNKTRIYNLVAYFSIIISVQLSQTCFNCKNNQNTQIKAGMLLLSKKVI